MSQRVQKGSTVFRPVAKPRPRAGGGSRQSSVLPESSATPGPSIPRNTQDGPPRAPSAMPPPSSVPQRPSADPFPSPHSVTAVNTGGDANALEAPTSQAVPMAGPSTPPSQPPAARIIPMPSRMPPRIGTSQPSSAQPGIAISMPSRTMARAPTLPPAPTPVMPVAPSHPGPSYSSDPLAFLPQHVANIDGPPSSVPYTIDSSQIDPLLMGPSAFAGLAPLQPQDNSPGEPSADPRPNVGISDIPAVKAARPRRTQRKKSDTAEATAEEGGDQDDAEGGDAPPKKKRVRKAATEDDQNSSPTGSKKRKRSETAEPRRSRKRAPSPPPFDAEADPGEELDPTTITMAALCDDNGRGRVSSKAAQIVSNHAAWRASNRDKRARMKAAMEAKKYGRDTEDEEGAAQSASQKPAEQDASDSASRAASVALDANASASGVDEDESLEKGVDGFDYGADMAVSRFNVQVRIGANGETIIDEQSLFVNRDEEHQTDDYTHVEESDFTKFVNSATYSKKLRGSRWSAEETELFYDALSQFGENYELISYVLPGRDRKACKNKFKAEDKKNSARITYCLNNRTPYDIETLSRMTGKDFSGPTPEIRAPTPLRSTELETASEVPAPSLPRAIRKKSRTPSALEAGVEIVGDIDEVEKEDFQQIGPDGQLVSV